VPFQFQHPVTWLQLCSAPGLGDAGSLLSRTVVVLGTSVLTEGSGVDRARHALLLWSALPLDAPQKPALVAVGRGVFKIFPTKAQVGLGAGWEIQAFWI